jgi:hypothetical protein
MVKCVQSLVKIEKRFFLFFHPKGGRGLAKKSRNELISGQKIVKTLIKYVFLNDVLKYNVLGHKLVKIDRF